MLPEYWMSTEVQHQVLGSRLGFTDSFLPLDLSTNQFRSHETEAVGYWSLWHLLASSPKTLALLFDPTRGAFACLFSTWFFSLIAIDWSVENFWACDATFWEKKASKSWRKEFWRQNSGQQTLTQQTQSEGVSCFYLCSWFPGQPIIRTARNALLTTLLSSNIRIVNQKGHFFLPSLLSDVPSLINDQHPKSQLSQLQSVNQQ